MPTKTGLQLAPGLQLALVLQIALAVLLAAGLASLAGPAQAHTRSQSYSTWQLLPNGEVRGTFTVDQRRATLLYALHPDASSLTQAVALHLLATIFVTAGDDNCIASGTPQILGSAPHQLRFELDFNCPQPSSAAPVQFRIGAFFPVAASHVHFIRVQDADGDEHETLLTASRQVFAPQQGATGEQQLRGFGAYVMLGAEHVASGYDHLAFLLALLLLAGSAWRILLTITGFTLGHSLTLALAVPGYIQPNERAVEALIGFSIAFVAVQAVLTHSANWRYRSVIPWAVTALCLLAGVLPALLARPGLPWAVTLGVALFSFCVLRADNLSVQRQSARGISSNQARTHGFWLATAFGLAHGAGFAGALLQSGVSGLPLLPTVLSFNLGVELGQIAIVAVLAGLYWLLRPLLAAHRLQLLTLCATLLWSLGLYWFFSRSLQF